MRTSSARRLLIIKVLVASLVISLGGRLFWVQLLDPDKPQQTAGATHDGRIVIPADRGRIVDASGRPLVVNRATRVVTVDRSTLIDRADAGRSVLTRLAGLLHTSVADLTREITPCGVKVPAPCWTGQPYEPVPVATDVDTAVVLALGEHREDYPGVAVETRTVRDYPGGSLAAHVLGYTGQVSAADEKADPALTDQDTIGRSGLEDSYDAYLRGKDGYRVVKLDGRGYAVGDGTTVDASTGDTLVTSIDAKVQALAEKSLQDQIDAARRSGKPATGGALVVMDPHTGRILAAASYPTYDPQVFIGGISVADYKKLTDPAADDPLISRAVAGQYAPGSTFKLVTSSSDVMNGLASLTGDYSCPGSLDIDGRTKTNYDSESIPGPVDLRLALQYSCDTWFYRFAADEYYSDQNRIALGQKPHEYLQHMAAAFGFGSSAQTDLPADEQTVGHIASRETRQRSWEQNKKQYCADARRGYPEVSDPATRAYLTQLASENCTDGWRYRAGDNADLAIGQGETTVSPLQLAAAYCALVNGGTLYEPTFGWAVEDPTGKIVKRITPKVKNHVPVDKNVLAYIRDSLQFTDSHQVSGAIAFDGSPIKTLISGKTGTAEVYGKQDTSWFASWGPSPSDSFVVVGMIEQAGTGASAAAPAVRQVYEGLLGVTGTALARQRPQTTVPTVVTDR